MPREIKHINHSAKTEHVGSLDDPGAWLLATVQRAQLSLRWLLAYTERGVIWGELRDGQLALSSEAFPADKRSLRPQTLQQVRMFGEDGELLLFRGPGGDWQHCLRIDTSGAATEYFDEDYLLWGYNNEQQSPVQQNGFIELREGSEGIVHAPPLATMPSAEKRARLRMRHYLQINPASGLMHVAASRLVKVIEAEG
jgi:CRISPR-associated protein (TIGR03984 family)